ncbi:hypothetical protein DENSPDRAFT_548919 [Dentipellis sp. KUC8613]|nr:hypothetical protein DENSPDRAFT_548919 [Dentipellis sp. KUC8613]
MSFSTALLSVHTKQGLGFGLCSARRPEARTVRSVRVRILPFFCPACHKNPWNHHMGVSVHVILFIAHWHHSIMIMHLHHPTCTCSFSVTSTNSPVSESLPAPMDVRAYVRTYPPCSSARGLELRTPLFLPTERVIPGININGRQLCPDESAETQLAL